jgi:hypothetical protein
MFVVEIGAGLHAGSASLQADALDFLGDAANYGISLFVVGMALRYRATAALVKGTTMGLFGLWVFGTAIWHVYAGTMPEASTRCRRPCCAGRQCRFVWTPVGLSRQRRQYAIGVDMHTQ